MISDYCESDKDDKSQDFLTYVAQRGYHLLTVKAYGTLLQKVSEFLTHNQFQSRLTNSLVFACKQKVGFQNVIASDRTEQFVGILQIELNRFMNNRKEFLHQFEEHDFDYIVSGWEAKLERCRAGDQKWGLFTATKALNHLEN